MVGRNIIFEQDQAAVSIISSVGSISRRIGLGILGHRRRIGEDAAWVIDNKKEKR